MNNFYIELMLNDDCYVTENHLVGVLKEERFVGTCRYKIENSRVYGLFELEDGISTPQYIKYNTTNSGDNTIVANIELFNNPTIDTVQKLL